MKRLAKILFLPAAMMIATVGFAQVPTNTPQTPSTPAPSNNTMRQTPMQPTSPSLNNNQGQNNSLGQPNQGIRPPVSLQNNQTRIQDSINRAERKAHKKARKEAKKQAKEAKKESKKMEKSKENLPMSDSTGALPPQE
ncbi:MAG TPA: hypothetical protein VFX43_04830 [Chitinophagaceae bacterium]|jgi:FKBP-type peptidyl-prolyl cis-trans isomerase|nr:hypothetical protein [Chitinophagaceae bacterium]